MLKTLSGSTTMASLTYEAIKNLSTTVAPSSELAHPDDMNKARELFSILHLNGEILLKAEVQNAAMAQGWASKDAEELGSLAQQIGEGKPANVSGGPWFRADIYEQIKSKVS